MLFPVKCTCCSEVIGHMWDDFTAHRDEYLEEHPEDVDDHTNVNNLSDANTYALDQLGITRYCCKRMFIGHVDIASEVVKYPRGTTLPGCYKIQDGENVIPTVFNLDFRE